MNDHVTEIQLGITPEKLKELYENDEAILRCKRRIEEHHANEARRRQALQDEIKKDWAALAEFKEEIRKSKIELKRRERLIRAKEKKTRLRQREIGIQERRIANRQKTLRNRLLKEVTQQARREFRGKFSGALSLAGLQ